MKGVLGMAPDIILNHNANACTRFNFLALVSIWVALIHILQQYDRILNRSDDSSVHPFACFRAHTPGIRFMCYGD